MKRYTSAAIFLILPLLVGCAATSQESGKSAGALPLFGGGGGGGVKIGYVRSDEISKSYPDYKDADNTLKADNDKWLAQATELEGKIRQKERELAEISLILSDDRKKELEKDLTTMRAELQKFRSDTWYSDNSSYVKRRREIMSPIDARVNEAIWQVSKDKNLDLVFDTISGNIVYAKEGLDITDLVLEELRK